MLIRNVDTSTHIQSTLRNFLASVPGGVGSLMNTSAITPANPVIGRFMSVMGVAPQLASQSAIYFARYLWSKTLTE